jgi:hypothetical protein
MRALATDQFIPRHEPPFNHVASTRPRRIASSLDQQSDMNLREVNRVTVDQHADVVAGMGAIELRDIDP